MNALVQKLGIDGSTTVVLTIPRGSSDGDHYPQSVAYWTFRYWGFARERVKLLNGGDDAWDVAGRPLTDAIIVPTPSTYERHREQGPEGHAAHLGGRDADASRTSMNRDRSLLNTWQMLDVRGFATSPYIANAYRGSGGMQFRPTG